MPFADFKDFDACLRAQRAKGHSEESSRKICGAIQARVEGKKMKDGADMNEGRHAVDAAIGHRKYAAKGDGLIFKCIVPFIKREVASDVPEEGTRTVYEAIASSGALDRDQERLAKTALRKGASDLLGKPVFFNHQHTALGLGRVVKSAYSEDDGKIHIGFVTTKAAGMQDAVTQIDEGILKYMSIGGKVKAFDMKYDQTLEKDIKVITDVDLYEVSVVGVPANPDASIAGAIHKAFTRLDKKMGKDLNIRKLRYALDWVDEGVGQTPKLARRRKLSARRGYPQEKHNEFDVNSDDEEANWDTVVPKVLRGVQRRFKNATLVLRKGLKPKILRRAPRKKEETCQNCGEPFKPQCPYCGALQPHPRGPNAPILGDKLKQ